MENFMCVEPLESCKKLSLKEFFLSRFVALKRARTFNKIIKRERGRICVLVYRLLSKLLRKQTLVSNHTHDFYAS